MPRDGVSNSFSGFCVAKNDLRRWQWEERDVPIDHLGSDQIMVGIAKFAFTANNVTYASTRSDLPIATYNEYQLTDRNANYDRLHEDHHLILRPLFSLSFFCAEYLKEERFSAPGRY
jgi:hypothetical protein